MLGGGPLGELAQQREAGEQGQPRLLAHVHAQIEGDLVVPRTRGVQATGHARPEARAELGLDGHVHVLFAVGERERARLGGRVHREQLLAQEGRVGEGDEAHP